ncbi:MAG: hypothetical protein K9H14_07510 [Actinomycetia bacterium]|nr:hypothetical protein [Actinomycetes bacterium]
MSRRVADNLTVVLLVVFTFLLVGYTVYSVEKQKAELIRMEEEQDRIEKLEQELREQQGEMREARLEELKKDREEKARNIIDFHSDYSLIRSEFLRMIASLEKDMDLRAVNIEEVEELTNERIDASKSLIDSYSGIEVPPVLDKFSGLLMDFLENDYNTWSLTSSYYNSRHYSTYNLETLNRLHQENIQLFKQAEDELVRVYKKYELDELTEDLY